MPSFCLLRLGAPHAGHAAIVERMLALDTGEPRSVVLVGSADVVGRADAALPWEERRDLLVALLKKRRGELGGDDERVVFAPLPELKTNGWDARWCTYLLDRVRAAMNTEPTRYVFGDDYESGVFGELVVQAPSLALVRMPRVYDKSARELRRAIRTGEPALLAKYEEELALYSDDQRARIAAASP